MKKFKYIIVLGIVALCTYSRAYALDIQYGTILGESGTNFLVQYDGIDQKNNYLCSVTTKKCSITKKTTLGRVTALPLSKSLKAQLSDKGANHMVLSASKNLLAYYQKGAVGTPRIFTVRNIKTGTEYTISENVSYWDLVDEQGRVFAFSPDSKKLVYIDDIDGAMSLYLADATKLKDNTISGTKLITKAYQIDDFMFTDSQTLYYIGNTKENPYVWSLYRYDFKTKKDTAIVSGLSYVDPLLKFGSSIVFTSQQAKGYGPALYNTTTHKVGQFSIPNINTKSTVTHQDVIHIGNETGVLMTPPHEDSSKTYPVVIWLHGGPYRQTSYGYHPYHSYGMYDAMLDLLQKNGVAVLKLDYRGSYGFGKAYTESLKDSVGTSDVDDVMNAVAYLKNRYHTSGVYLTGNSYGGYLALKSIVEHPDAITSVLSINGVTDWESLLISLKTSIFNVDFDGLPGANNQILYEQASIINKISNLSSQKIELVQGQSDRTIPPWQADLLYGKLQATGKNVTITKYDGQDHVFSSKSAIDGLCVQMFNFVGIPADPECNN
jgi:dipeptidyl aminopeptidase/acylaminoacyl peptidase